MNTLTKEEKLISGLRRHSHTSLEKAIELYTPYVTVVVYGIIGAVMAREDIEEVVSDVFLSLWRNATGLDGGKGSLRAYLAAAARNASKNKLRTLRTHEGMDESIISDYKTPQDAALEREKREILTGIIKSLGEPDSEIFLRYYYYEEKITDIAKTVGLNSSTVKSRLSRGRKKIKEYLIERGYGNE